MAAALHSRWNQFRNQHGNRLVRSNSFTLHLSPAVYVSSGRNKSKKNPVTPTKMAAIKTLAFKSIESPDVIAKTIKPTSTSAAISSTSAAPSTSARSTKTSPDFVKSTSPASLKPKKFPSVSGKSIPNKAPPPPINYAKTPPTATPKTSPNPITPTKTSPNQTNSTKPPTSVRSTKSNSTKPTVIPAPTKPARNPSTIKKTSPAPPPQSTKPSLTTTKCSKAAPNQAKASKIPIPSTKSTRAPSIPCHQPRSSSTSASVSPNIVPPVTTASNLPPSDDQQQQTVRYIFSKTLPGRPTSLAAIQKPLLDVYLAHLNRDRSSVPAVVDVLDDGLRVQYAERDGSDIVEMTNQFHTIAYWAAVQCVVRPPAAATDNKPNSGVAIGFFPFTENGEYLTKSGGGGVLSSDGNSDQADELFQWLDDGEQHRSLLDTEHAPLFACIMRRSGSASAALYCHVFLCGNAVQAIQLASDLYRKLNGNLRRQRQHSGTGGENNCASMSVAPVVTNDVPGGSAWCRSGRQTPTPPNPKPAEPKPPSHNRRHPTTTKCPLHGDQPKRTSSRQSAHSSSSHPPKPKIHPPRPCYHHHHECRLHQPAVCSQCSRPYDQGRPRPDKTGTQRSSSFSQLLLHGLRRLAIKDLCCNTSTGTGFRQKIRAHFQHKTREPPIPAKRQQRRHSDIYANTVSPKLNQSGRSSTRSDLKRRYRSSQRPPAPQPSIKKETPSHFNRSSSIGSNRPLPVYIKSNSQPRPQRWDRKLTSGGSDHVYQSLGSGSGRLDGAPSLSTAKANWVKLLGFIDGAKYQTPHALRPRSRDGESDPILGRQTCVAPVKCGLSRRVRVAGNIANAPTAHRRQSSAMAADIIVRPIPSPRRVQHDSKGHLTKMEIVATPRMKRRDTDATHDDTVHRYDEPTRTPPDSGTEPASCVACRRKDRPAPPTSSPPLPSVAPPPRSEQAYAEISETVVACEKLPTDVPSMTPDSPGGAASGGQEVAIQCEPNNAVKISSQSPEPPAVKTPSQPIVCTIGLDADMDDDDLLTSDNEFDSLEDDLFFLSPRHRRVKPTSSSTHLSSTLTKARTHLTGTSQRVFRRFFGTPDSTSDTRHRKSLPVVVGATLSTNRSSSVFGCPPSDLLTSDDTALRKKDAEIVSVLEQIFQRAVTAAAVAAAATVSDCRVSDVVVGRPPAPQPRLRAEAATVKEVDDVVSDNQVAIPSGSTEPHWGWATFLP